MGYGGDSILAFLVCQSQTLMQLGLGFDPQGLAVNPSGWIPLLSALNFLISARHWLASQKEAQAGFGSITLLIAFLILCRVHLLVNKDDLSQQHWLPRQNLVGGGRSPDHFLLYFTFRLKIMYKCS